MIYSMYVLRYQIRLDFKFFLVEEGVIWSNYYWYEEYKGCWEMGVRKTPELSGLRMNTIFNPTLLIVSTGFPRDLKAEHSYEAFSKLERKKAKKQLP